MKISDLEAYHAGIKTHTTLWKGTRAILLAHTFKWTLFFNIDYTYISKIILETFTSNKKHTYKCTVVPSNLHHYAYSSIAMHHNWPTKLWMTSFNQLTTVYVYMSMHIILFNILKIEWIMEPWGIQDIQGYFLPCSQISGVFIGKKTQLFIL